ncbi:MAG TPA: hypothetical protein VFD73_02355, partial [Gemmatimonadales bacterium]|nr:hypothetical protein [Gemmatimonadales bacterium]
RILPKLMGSAHLARTASHPALTAEARVPRTSKALEPSCLRLMLLHRAVRDDWAVGDALGGTSCTETKWRIGRSGAVA